MRLALVGLLAGEMGTGGGCSSHFNVPSTHHPRGSEEFIDGGVLPQLMQHATLFAELIVVLVVLGLVLTIVFLYIGSVMRFILFDSIVKRECHIREGWAWRQGAGLRLFVWQILLMLVSLGSFVILIGVPLVFVWALGWLKQPGEHVLPLVLGGGVALMVLVVVLLVLIVVQVLTKDFVVPQMALEEISAQEGWRRLWTRLKAEPGGYGGYIGMKVVLAIGAGIAVGIVTVIVVLAIAIPAGSFGLVAVLSGKFAGLSWNVYTIALAVVAGLIAVAIFMFIVAMISVPVIVFFPAYSIYFFASRYAPLAAVLWPPQPMVAGGSPPTEPPGLPPGIPTPPG
jgi:hypothetical protein